MIILSLRTDKEQSEIGLHDDKKQMQYITWQADRTLTETIHGKISEVLNKSNKSLKDIEGIACFKGPGSFTGLRIGLSVANALAYSLNVPIVAKSGEHWIDECIKELLIGKNHLIAIPEYGADVKTTRPRK